MKTNRPIWTYIITFLNPIIPSFIIIFLGICFVLWSVIDEDTHAVTSQITFTHLYYPTVLIGIYLCMLISFFHYYLIRKGILRPRWWLNLLLVILGYGLIPLLALLFGPKGTPDPQAVNENADALILMNYFIVVIVSIVGFFTLTVITKEAPILGTDLTRTEQRGDGFSKGNEMDLKKLWLSPKGRATRKDFWLRTYLPFMAIYLLAIAIDMVFGLYDETSGVGLVSIIAYILIIWPMLCVVIKRCHDRDRSGWFILEPIPKPLLANIYRI